MSRTTRAPSARAARIGFLAAPFLGLAVAVLLVWQSSYAAFSATTTNGTNNWAAGSVALSDNDTGTALFNPSGLVPGSTGARCIAVTSTGSLPATVELYGAGLATTNGLSSYLDIVVTQGTGTAADCSDFTPLGVGSGVYTGTLAAFTATTFAGGYGDWAPTGSGSETRAFKFTYTLNASAPNTTQSGTASIGFTWEAQNS